MKEKFKEKLESHRRKNCELCGKIKAVVLRRNIAASGISQVYWYCQDCERMAIKGGKFIGHDVVNYWITDGRLKVAKIDDIPIVTDYSVKQFCEVCGATGAEFHHIAPQALADLFGDDWYLWPGAYLCQEHHTLWHSIVTWYMPGPAAPHPEMLARYGGVNVSSN